MSDEDVGTDKIRGERGATAAIRVISVQSRVSNLLALGLIGVLGFGSLAWYYAKALVRQDRTKQSAAAASTSRAQGDTPLPSLGRIDSPAPAAAFDSVPQQREPSQDQPPPQTLVELPLAPTSLAMATGATPPESSVKTALARQLSGAVFVSTNANAAPVVADPLIGPTATTAGVEDRRGMGTLTSLLHTAASTSAPVQQLPAQRLLLPKGAFLDCTLETAIDSTLPGMTSCVLATDAFGVDGSVVLLERGTKLIGETRGQVQQGAARIFVTWSEARTPTGIIVPLDSPGADELGRSGLPGEVERHFWERFGAAMLVSVIDGAVQTAVQSSRNGGTVILNPSGSQDVLTEILKNTVNVPPTVIKKHGDRIQVLVARDLDFRSVYELRSVAAGR